MSRNKVIFDVLANSSQYKKQMTGVEKTTDKTTKAVAASFAIASAAIGGTLVAFAQYETGLKKVGKTADLQGKELDDFGKRITELSAKIPLSTKELLDLAASAAQLGVKGKDNILKFTATIAKLGTATNIVGEEGAQAIARLLNITGEGVGAVDRFGAVITRLGNNTAASESEILSMATRVGQATTQFDIGTTAVLGISAALKEVGVQAEVGGSVVGRTFIEMQKAISAGGSELETFAQVTGMTGEQLKQTFEQDAAGAFQALISGLNKIPADQFNAALEEMNLKGIRFNQVLAPMAKRSDILARSLAMASDEAEKQTALNKEFAIAVDSLANQFNFFKTEVFNLAKSIGGDLAPAAKELLNDITRILKEIRALNEATGGMITTSVVMAAKVSALVLVVNKLKNVLLLTGLFSGKFAVQMGVATAATQRQGLMSSLGAKQNTAFAFSFGKVATSSRAALVALKSFQVGLGGLIGGLIIAVELGQKLGDVIGKLGEKMLDEESSEKKLISTQRQLNNLLAVRLKIQEAIARGDDGAEERLAKIDKEIAQRKGLIGVLEREIAVRTGTGEGSADIPMAAGAPGVPGVDTGEGDSGGLDLGSKEKEKTDALIAEIDARVAATEREAELLNQIQKGASDESVKIAEDRNRQLGDIEGKKLELERLNQDLSRTGINENEQLILEAKKAAAEQELLLMETKFADQQTKTAEQEAVDMENRIAGKEILNVALTEQELLFREEKLAREEEERALDLETKAVRDQEDLIFLQSKLITEQQAEDQVRQARLTKDAAAHNTSLKNEAQFGKAVGKMKTFFDSEEVKGVQSTLGLISQIKTKEGSAAGKAQKAFALADAAIKIPQAVLGAYTSMVGIPIVGPILAPIAATAAGIIGMQQLNTIRSQKSPSYAVGTDFVPGNTMAQIHQGEAIIPARQNQFLQSGELVLGSPDSVGGNNGGSSEEPGINVNISFEGANFVGDVSESEQLTEQLFEALAVGIEEGRLPGFEQAQLKVTN